ncbi:MAG TPA: single-stranded-DNA-specific exonuclease RecJ [Thermodesulfovibrionales bacterium]|nr:single-stranded-DNA-specific exonuclease RecJ [Thermodesulfovibrionales bacterium]
MNCRWLLNKTNPEFVRYLSRLTAVSPLLAQILINRGIKSADTVHAFLHPALTSLSDPYDLPDMKAAVERIKVARDRGERVLVHGDYDADGLTSTAIMVSALRTLGIDVSSFIPNRMSHGYGFNPVSVGIAKKFGAKLIITVDCGISSVDAAGEAKREGIDVIITDHHEPSKEPGSGKELLIPDAVAVIDPKLQSSGSALSTLAGAGVAFKVAQAFALDGDLPFTDDDSFSLLDLAALGTLADVVPLIGENRAIMKEGLRSVRDGRRPGIKALMEVSGITGREIKAGLLSFTVVPRINAAGRMGDAGDVVGLLLSDSDEETSSMARILDHTNSERQRIEEEVYQEALFQLEAKGYDAAIVLSGKGWHIGVLGIVASRIAEEFRRPAFIFSIAEGIAKGSARSVPAFDVYGGIYRCRDIVIAFGGHKQAAGVKVDVSSLPAFEERMNSIVRDLLEREEAVPAIEIDAEVNLSEITASLVQELSLLEPLGNGNPEPLLGARKLDVIKPRVVGSNHIRMRLQQRSSSLDAIGFDMARLFESLSSASLDAVFTPMMNEWNGSRRLQLNLKAFRPSQ